MGLRAALPAVLAALTAAVAGCGVGAGAEREGGGATLRVTRDFGAQVLSSGRVEKVREDQTVMRLLRADNDVKTRYGGNFVQSIDGLSGGGESGSADWFYFVNGIEAGKGAAEYELNPGDVVQWDYRNWRAAMVRATVGAFPEPFLHGAEGRRFPTRVECEDASSRACEQVKDTLDRAGVPATGASLGAAGNQQVARVVVATWARARQLPTARALEDDPGKSGVFARFRDGGRKVELLDERGEVAATGGPDTGIVAARRPSDTEILWLITGGDERGLDAAVKAFDVATLRDAFAVAATPDGPQHLPLEDGS
ncbi:MAG TPA: DUF4430 domain-containing protein [Thermoleophilaceae bacterium]|nr:DUF4430 domain-containing protein [Thermoleophilaceae bacterium]